MLKKSWTASTNPTDLSGIATFQSNELNVSFEMQSLTEFNLLCQIIESYREQEVLETVERLKFRINNILN